MNELDHLALVLGQAAYSGEQLGHPFFIGSHRVGRFRAQRDVRSGRFTIRSLFKTRNAGLPFAQEGIVKPPGNPEKKRMMGQH